VKTLKPQSGMTSALPSAADVEFAREVARRIAAVRGERVRRVIMIGSRALGTPRPDSDLDLVVLVEPLPGTPPWRSADSAAARRRLQEELGPMPVPTEIWVRTTDRYEEARDVVGGVEWLADREGVEVYACALQRPPRLRLSPDQIRRQNVSAWVEHACLALDAAAAGATRAVLGRSEDTAQTGANAVVERALNAVLVAHQVYASKREGAQGMLDKLSPLDPWLAQSIRGALGSGPPTLAGAHRVLGLAVRRLAQDSEMVRYLEGPIQRLARPMVLLAG
jgi:predicted nucleotidyltransferase